MRLWNNLLKIFLPQDWPFSMLFSTGHPQYTNMLTPTPLPPCLPLLLDMSTNRVGTRNSISSIALFDGQKKKKNHSLILDGETLLEFYWHLKFSFDADIFTCGPTSLGEKTKATGGSFLGIGPDWVSAYRGLLFLPWNIKDYVQII